MPVSATPAAPAADPPGAPHQEPPGCDVQSMVRQRRAGLPPALQPGTGDGTWGLALSGGGIRSATFCFGLIKALAQNRVMHRFDILSTVSGGGYIGSTVGKLFQDAPRDGRSAEEIETALGDCDTRWFAFWLRANGRYLIPRGAKDLLFAAANFIRNLIGVHIELAVMCLLLGCLLVGVDLALWQWADCVYSRNGCVHPSWLNMKLLDAASRWPTLWLLLPLPALVAASLAAAYWALPSKAGERLPLQRWLMAALCLAGCWTLASHWSTQQVVGARTDGFQPPGWLMLVAVGALASWIFGTVIAQVLTLRYPTTPDGSRNKLTASLAHALFASFVIIGLGLVDLMAWVLASARAEHQGAAGMVVLLTVAALRAVLPKIADLPRSLTPGTRINLNGLISLAGLAVGAMLLVFWVSVVHRSATLALFDDSRRVLQFSLGWLWFGLIAVPASLMVLVSFWNREFLNRSSLYAFYRARLVRGYLGAANVARFGGHPKAATDHYRRSVAASGPAVSVQEVNAGDDIAMADYAPHRGGGPVHLINACVNQTCDSRGGLFNQDRKGLLMTVGPHGHVRVGQEGWRRVDRAGSLTLGSWVAISGAAVAPGLGSSTKSGIATLLTLSGVRLGYWWDSLCLQRDDGARPGAVLKYGQLLAELRGRFDGINRADWYLSDGGHFENTAAYALLREECSLVVVADCGADPRYAFGDLENLVRKARIDLQADITFLKPRKSRAEPVAADREPPSVVSSVAAPDKEGQPLAEPTVPPVFGSLNDLVSMDSQACLALARINYRSGETGHLLIVKPNMCSGVPVDLVNFKADHPLFPQEPTTDQFFSEAQWESYFQLGNTLGLNLKRRMLDDLPRFAATWFEVDDGRVTVRDDSGLVHTAAPKRLPSRIAATGAVTASVSLGALATLGATAWQAADQQIQARDKARRLDPAALKELTDLFGKLMPDAGPEPTSAAAAGVAGSAPAEGKSPTRLGEMATALLRVGDATCTLDNAEAFRRSVLMQMILNGTKKSCRDTSPRHPSCEVLLDNDNSVACLHDSTEVSCVPRYWLRDWKERDATRQNCLVTPPRSEDTGSLFQAVSAWLGLGAAPLDASPPSASVPPPQDPASASAPIEPGKTQATRPDHGASGRPAAAASAPDASVPPPPQPSDACRGKTVYIQIYGPEMRDMARLLRDPWRALGANVPPIEDVWDSARRRGRDAPEPPRQPTVVFHDAGSRACAELLQPAGTQGSWAVRPLSTAVSGTTGTLEVWIPPAGTPATGPGARPAFNAQMPQTAFCYQEDMKQDGPRRYGVHCHAEAAACEKARGPNKRRRQSACVPIEGSSIAAALTQRGWGGSWYALQATPFDPPFPPLP